MSPEVNLERARAAFSLLREEAERQWRALSREDASYVLVGGATCGRSAGALKVLEAFREQFASHNLQVPVIEVGCFGHCYAEPTAIVKRPGYPGMMYHHLTPIIVANLVQKFFFEEDPYFEALLGATEKNEMFPALEDMPRYGLETRRILSRCGRIDPENIYHALALDAYQGLMNALEKQPEELIGMLKAANLRGLGGAGFPLWRKWEMIMAPPEGTCYLICNADEGDPGAFMDRTILESDPHAVLEGMLIGAYITDARQGFIYVRHEYPLAVKRCQIAIAQARAAGLLGASVLNSGVSFDIEVAQGAGAFVCGEETALIASVEGKRGMPRVRPPYPSQAGLFGKPTAVNNVKTLASVPLIMTHGPEWFASIGTRRSKGTAVFALAGKIANPGLVEVPMGATLRQVIFEIGGGIPKGKKFKAVHIGGPSGGCLPEGLLNLPINFDSLSAVGMIMGSGGMVILDEDNCIVDTAKYFLEFIQKESCGKCTFCRIGTKQMLEILTAITEGTAKMEDLDTLVELAEEIKAGSLCNLGKTAPNMILTTLRYFREELQDQFPYVYDPSQLLTTMRDFRDEYEAHIKEKRCPAKVCKALTAYYILPERCVRSCDACVGSCPAEAIYPNSKRIKVIDQGLCVKCNSCMGACPPDYDAVVKISPLSEVPASEPRPKKKAAEPGAEQ